MLLCPRHMGAAVCGGAQGGGADRPAEPVVSDAVSVLLFPGKSGQGCPPVEQLF